MTQSHLHRAAAPPAVSGRRERKKAATHAALREAAQRLVARHGVDVTLEQIADEADIAVRTFFNYFSSKEEVLVAPLAAGAEALISEFRARPATESVLQALREAALLVLQADIAVRREEVGALRLIARAPSLLPQRLAVFAAQEEALAAAIAERVKASPRHDGMAAGALYPELCAGIMLTAMRIVLDKWLDHATDAGDVPFLTTIRNQISQVVAQLTAGLDWPGAPS